MKEHWWEGGGVKLSMTFKVGVGIIMRGILVQDENGLGEYKCFSTNENWSLASLGTNRINWMVKDGM